jgi:hypothetical protein
MARGLTLRGRLAALPGVVPRWANGGIGMSRGLSAIGRYFSIVAATLYSSRTDQSGPLGVACGCRNSTFAADACMDSRRIVTQIAGWAGQP